MAIVPETSLPADGPAAVRVDARRLSADGVATAVERLVPEELPVAIVHDGSTTAVMMASPGDGLDFAVGFSITERIVAGPEEIREVEVLPRVDGLELRVWLRPGAGQDLRLRRRAIVGPTGCGLCGVESLEAAVKMPPAVTGDLVLGAAEILAAMRAMGAAQALGRQTRATHAAGFWLPGEGLAALREDVGRHNALDKLVGAVIRSGGDGSRGAVLVTSRLSVEMVQKTAALGAPVLVAVSAPTTLAIRTAQAAGLTLVAVARDDGFEVFTHPERIVGASDAPAGAAIAEDRQTA